MINKMGQKELTLVYAAIGFGSVALVGLGELSNVDPKSPLFRFYLNLVFGGLAVLYIVFIHLSMVTFMKKIDKVKKSKIAKFFLGEKSSFNFSVVLIVAVLAFWLYNFAELMEAYELKFF